MVVMVEIIKDEAINLLTDMECLDLIKMNVTVKNTDTIQEKLSSRFAGAMNLSDEKYEEFQNSIREGRKEWAQAIY